MTEGILLVDKKKGITSYDVIRGLKRELPKGIKIGHAGTLDPFATGLLIVMIGRGATKLMNNFHKLQKEYEVEAKFGFATDTQDITGKIIKRSEKEEVSLEIIREILDKEFRGVIEQTPPIYSAKKIAGKKAYELAREGKDVKLSPKKVNIYEIDILKYSYPTLKLRVVCSTGTYIRTIVNDLGEKFGLYATATELRRTKIGPFSLKDCSDSIIPLDKVLEKLSYE